MSNYSNVSYLATTESTLYHTSLTWVIDNFSYQNTLITSPTFADEKKNTFYLQINPREREFVSLKILLSSAHQLTIKYHLSLVNSTGDKCRLHFKTRSFEQTQIYPHPMELLIPKFISRDDLFKASNGYLPGDTLTLICKIGHLGKRKASLKNTIGLGQMETMQKAMADYGSLLESGNLADVKLLVGGKTIPAHKLILAARSSVFAAMFAHDMKEKKEGQVVILDVSLKAFETLLEFLYTSALPTLDNIGSAQELLLAADKYNIEQLKTVCEDYLINQMTVETAPSLLLFANSVNAPELKKNALEFIHSRSSQLFEAMKTDPEQMINMFGYLAKQNEPKEAK